MAGLDVRLLGGFSVSLDGRPLQLTSAPARELLSYVLVNRIRPERADLAYLLWPGSSERQARTNLRRTLHYLRSSAPGIEAFFELAGPRFGAFPDAFVRLDMTAFEQALATADGADQRGEHDALHRALRHGVHLYGGDLLPGCYADWVEAERERLRSAYRRMLERLVDHLVRRGEPDRAVEYAERIVRSEPLDERAYRRLMRLHLRAGRRAAALAVFRSCVDELERELSIGPSLDTLALKEEAIAVESSWHRPLAAVRRRDGIPFVGRLTERNRLEATWRHACDEGSLLAHVHGDPGIGTSRLLEAFTEGLAARGVKVAMSHAYPGDQSVAFAPLVVLLRSPCLRLTIDRLDGPWRAELSQLLPELEGDHGTLASHAVDGHAADDGRRRHRLFDAVAQAFSRAAPIVLVIDDAHLADAPTLACLHHVLRSATKAGVLVIAASHTINASDHPAFTALTASLRHDAMMVEIPVGPLSAPEARLLVGHLCGRACSAAARRALVESAKGNPSFLIEAALRTIGCVRSHDGRAAAELRSVIADRLLLLPANLIGVAATAAAIGRSFTVEQLSLVNAGNDHALATELAELRRARVIDEVGVGAYTFIHEALYEAAERMLSRTQRELVERRVAHAMRRPAAAVDGQPSPTATGEQAPAPVTISQPGG